QRKEGQKVVHLILKVSEADAVNQILRDGMVICSKRVRARKMAKEPRRCLLSPCLKCQKVDTNHIAANCQSEKDTCGTSRGEHKTRDCTEKDPAKFKCTNCNVHRHASWGRECPVYKRTAQRLRQRDTEATYRYIPTEQPWTWEQEW
ncbi:hypothetical protein M422DRAFT_77832, partial [Sphaerobolus stellatus SS14]